MTTETAVTKAARLEHAKFGPNWRNNIGSMTDPETGSFVRFGLGHEYKMKDDDPRSSDIIGITPTLILPHMVGYWLGVFTAFEMKPSGWKMLPSDKRAHGQARFHDIVRANCGYAGFVTDRMDIYPIIGQPST